MAARKAKKTARTAKKAPKRAKKTAKKGKKAAKKAAKKSASAGEKLKEFDFVTNAPDDVGANAFAEQRRWQLVWLRLIADAWHSPEFRKQVTRANPSDLRALIKKQYNYDLNENLSLKIKQNRKYVRIEDSKQPFNQLPPIEMAIYLPPAPRPENQAIALADYSDAGRVYPFTCW